MQKKIENSDWSQLLAGEFEKDYYLKLNNFLADEYRGQTIYPKMDDVFNAFHYTPFEELKVVMLGQDPYHGPNQAQGLSFSVNCGVNIPPSLRNIYKELNTDIGCPIPNHGSLVKWAEQGVLLLNNVLTVRAGQAHSHRGMGWETFTNRVIEVLNQKDTSIIYILWGAAAQKKKAFVDTSKHYIIQSVHPSPLSAYRGFYGSKPFSKVNTYLKETGQQPIDWEIPNCDKKET